MSYLWDLKAVSWWVKAIFRMPCEFHVVLDYWHLARWKIFSATIFKRPTIILCCFGKNDISLRQVTHLVGILSIKSFQ
jgi:hypothetical protein